jgi:hypothetical protein
VISFTIPIEVWRTGELPAPPLGLVDGGPAVDMPARIWIDTDAACGHSRTTDPDDCFVLLLLAHAPGVRIAGISTVFGNAPSRSPTAPHARWCRSFGARDEIGNSFFRSSRPG